MDLTTKAPLLLAVDAGLLIPHIALLVEKGLGPLLDATGTTSTPLLSGRVCFIILLEFEIIFHYFRFIF